MYRPDPRIVRYLREYDPDLGATWDQFRERWIVTWRGKPAMTCQYDDGSFMPLDERMVTKAKLNDMWTQKSTRDWLKIRDEENHRIMQADRAKHMDDFRQYCKEDGYRKLVGVGSGGGRSMFSGWSASA